MNSPSMVDAMSAYPKIIITVVTSRQWAIVQLCKGLRKIHFTNFIKQASLLASQPGHTHRGTCSAVCLVADNKAQQFICAGV